jgi:hypothetical protein
LAGAKAAVTVPQQNASPFQRLAAIFVAFEEIAHEIALAVAIEVSGSYRIAGFPNWEGKQKRSVAAAEQNLHAADQIIFAVAVEICCCENRPKTQRFPAHRRSEVAAAVVEQDNESVPGAQGQVGPAVSVKVSQYKSVGALAGWDILAKEEWLGRQGFETCEAQQK